MQSADKCTQNKLIEGAAHGEICTHLQIAPNMLVNLNSLLYIYITNYTRATIRQQADGA